MTETPVTTAAQFSAWLASGDTPVCVYHVGHLAGDLTGSPEHQNKRALAREVWAAAVGRQVYLMQRRFRGEPMEYLAIRADGKVPRAFAPDPPRSEAA